MEQHIATVPSMKLETGKPKTLFKMDSYIMFYHHLSTELYFMLFLSIKMVSFPSSDSLAILKSSLWSWKFKCAPNATPFSPKRKGLFLRSLFLLGMIVVTFSPLIAGLLFLGGLNVALGGVGFLAPSIPISGTPSGNPTVALVGHWESVAPMSQALSFFRWLCCNAAKNAQVEKTDGGPGLSHHDIMVPVKNRCISKSSFLENLG